MSIGIIARGKPAVYGLEGHPNPGVEHMVHGPDGRAYRRVPIAREGAPKEVARKSRSPVEMVQTLSGSSGLGLGVYPVDYNPFSTMARSRLRSVHPP